MASFFCHVFGVTKQVRLERIVRPLCGDLLLIAMIFVWNVKVAEQRHDYKTTDSKY